MRAGEDQLGVGALPQQEIAEAAFSSGADQQVDRRAQRLSQRFERGRAQPPHRFDDGIPRGIIHGQSQAEAAAGGGSFLGGGNRRPQRAIQPVAAADHFQPHALLHAARSLVLQVGAEQQHQRVHLCRGPAPVVRGEGE